MLWIYKLAINKEKCYRKQALLSLSTLYWEVRFSFILFPRKEKLTQHTYGWTCTAREHQMHPLPPIQGSLIHFHLQSSLFLIIHHIKDSKHQFSFTNGSQQKEIHQCCKHHPLQKYRPYSCTLYHATCNVSTNTQYHVWWKKQTKNICVLKW